MSTDTVEDYQFCFTGKAVVSQTGYIWVKASLGSCYQTILPCSFGGNNNARNLCGPKYEKDSMWSIMKKRMYGSITNRFCLITRLSASEIIINTIYDTNRIIKNNPN